MGTFRHPRDDIMRELERLGLLAYDISNDEMRLHPALTSGQWLDKVVAQNKASSPLTVNMSDPNTESIPAPTRHLNPRLLLTRKA